jgi:hypothetical protein
MQIINSIHILVERYLNLSWNLNMNSGLNIVVCMLVWNVTGSGFDPQFRLNIFLFLKY